MEVAVTCSNKKFCELAEKAIPLDPGLVACPRCSKLLASPHRLSIKPTPGFADLGADSVSVTIERLSAPVSVTGLTFRLDGRPAGTHPRPTSLSQGSVGKFPADLKDGHLITAVLETDDGYQTVESLPWFGYRRGGLLAMLVLLAAALLCLWFNFAYRTALPTASEDTWAGLLLITAGLGTLACAWLYRKARRLGAEGIVVMVIAAGIVIALVARQIEFARDLSPPIKNTAIMFLVPVALAVVVGLIVAIVRQIARRGGGGGHPSSGKQDA